MTFMPSAMVLSGLMRKRKWFDASPARGYSVRPGQQETEAPPLEVQRAERHAARVHARRFRGGKAFQLLAQEGGGALQPVELAVAVAAEEPGAPRPVAGVVAHRDQEGDLAGDEVPDEGKQDEPDDQVDRERQRVDVEDRHAGMGDE